MGKLWIYMAKRRWLGMVEYHKWRLKYVPILKVVDGPYYIPWLSDTNEI